MGIHALCLPEGVDVDAALRDEDYGFDSVESQDNADELFGDALAERRLAERAYRRVMRPRRRSSRRKVQRARFEIPAYGD